MLKKNWAEIHRQFNAFISTIRKPSRCTLRLAELYLYVSQAECEKKETWERS